MSRQLKANLLTLSIVALVLGCGGRPVQWSDTGSSSSDEGGNGGSSSALSGVWARTVSQDGIEQEVFLTFESGGICEVLLEIPDFGPYPVPCTYTVSGDQLEIQDTECEGDGYGEGTYSYSISGSTLSLSVIDDDCPTRGPVLPGDWTRSSD
jgi:hypothetical protein